MDSLGRDREPASCQRQPGNHSFPVALPGLLGSASVTLIRGAVRAAGQGGSSGSWLEKKEVVSYVP